ncbi:MAG: pyridoxal phosphate-dependent aminotransferase [Bryobacteraceae bacterium]|nr:pyridoxal phosphate-dependent aminotransferase [Bryobacteraceae bacterium]
MFSRRLPARFEGNRLSRALAERRSCGLKVLDLTESNPTRAFDAPDLRAVFASPRLAVYDPSPFGLDSTRHAVAQRFPGVDAQSVLLTSSTSESYSWLFKLLADPGDEILVPRPSYPLFEYLAAFESVEAKPYRLDYHGRWQVDPASIADAVTPRTRAIVAVNPNNPTGSFLKAAERDLLFDLAARHGLALISDEVFFDYALRSDPNRVSLSGEAPVLTFTLGGLSKAAGLPQMKLGWMVVGGPPHLRESALERLELIADTYLSVGTPVQVAAPALLALSSGFQEMLMARLHENLAYLQRVTAEAPAFELLDVEGGWYAILRVPKIRSEEEWTLDLLERRGVLVQPGYFYDFEREAYLVLSLITRGDPFREGVECILTL